MTILPNTPVTVLVTLFLVPICVCGEISTPSTDNGSAEGVIYDGGSFMDSSLVDGEASDWPGPDMRIIVDSCDCEDLGPCLVLPVFCNSEIDGCVYSPLDNDSDGHPPDICLEVGGDDCDDIDPAIYPGAPELCDGKDNDCDDVVDEKCK